MKEYKFIIKRGISDQNERQLILNEQFIKFENKDYIHDAFTIIEKEEISGIRYGIRRISLFGIDFQIFIKYAENSQIKIDFTTYFNRNKSNYLELHNSILNAMWDFYFLHIANDYMNKFNNKIDFEIANIQFNQKGIFYQKGVINSKKIEIPWENVRTYNYQTNFVVADFNKLNSINKQLSYLEDWNVSILYCVIRTILNHKGIEMHE